MITRILPQDEWPRLIGTEAETLWPLLASDTAQIMVVEDEGRIIATWTLIRMVHAECLWIDPSRRGSFAIMRRLLSKMKEMAAQWGASSVVTGSASEFITSLIGRLGGSKIPGESFILPMGEFGTLRKQEREKCPQQSQSQL